MEGRNPRARSLVADRLGRSGLRHHGGAGRRDRRGAARPARLAAAARRPPLRRDGPRSEDGQDGLAAGRARSRAARAVARRQRHVGVQLAHHRRRAALRLLRVVRDLRLRPERQAALGEGPRRQAHAERVRRGLDAGDPRQHDGHRLGSSERRVVRRRARHARWQGAVAAAPQGNRHLGDAADPRGERPAAGDRARHGTCPQLRPGHRPAWSGRATG